MTSGFSKSAKLIGPILTEWWIYKYNAEKLSSKSLQYWKVSISKEKVIQSRS